MTKPAESDQIAKARARAEKRMRELLFHAQSSNGTVPRVFSENHLTEVLYEFAASERQAVIEECAKMADQIAKSCSACSYSRKKHGEEPSFCENFGCSSFADLAAAIRSME